MKKLGVINGVNRLLDAEMTGKIPKQSTGHKKQSLLTKEKLSSQSLSGLGAVQVSND